MGSLRAIPIGDDAIMTGEFDPRFDPRFQPGYEDEPGEREFTPPPSDPEYTVAPTPEPSVIAGAVASGEVPGDGDDAQGQLPMVELLDEEREPNPFERTLWVVAAVFVLGGASAAFWANSQNFYGLGTDWLWPQMFQSSAWALSGPMVTVGFAIGVALIFRRAISWKSWE